MYNYTVYRGERGAAPSEYKSLMTLTAEYESVARLVERLKVQNPGYDYCIICRGGFISRHEACKRTIMRAYRQNPATAEEHNGAYIEALRRGLLIGEHEAEQLYEYNAELARRAAGE
jgi:hypothetical protein